MIKCGSQGNSDETPPKFSHQPRGSSESRSLARSWLGAALVINGPVRWPMLTGIPEAQQETWDDRIHSLRIGPAATLTVYTEREFKGDTRQFTAGTAIPQLDTALSSTIKSLALACQ